MSNGYYRYPTIHADTVIFVCEDDLWHVHAHGGVARRLTANLSEVSWPVLSRDGQHVAFVGREEGQPEIFLMPSIGGPSQRLTFLGNRTCQTAAWTPDDQIVFGHSGGQPFQQMQHLYSLNIEDKTPTLINIGPANAISFGPEGGVVIGRNNRNPARWKRYRGGTAGQIWIDEDGNGQYRPLIDTKGNLDCPLWLGGRIYFLSDHEGIGNLYSCLPSGSDLQRHTDHEEFYARNASSDGRRIVYHAGANLYLYDPYEGSSQIIPVDFHSPQTQRNRKFVSASRYLQDWSVHPKGHSVAITTRGKPFAFSNWEGAVVQYAQENEARYRLLTWLHDGQRLIAVTDAGGEENFLILNDEGHGPARVEIIEGLDIGRPLTLKVNPQKNQILFSNHRYELLCLDLDTKELSLIDRGKSMRISGFNWSPDGEWAVYSVSTSMQVSMLKLWSAESDEIYPLTKPVLHDVEPAFDPEGKYIYFLSYREFDPVYDNMHFDLNFPYGIRPYLITLQKDQTSPFTPTPKTPLINGEGSKDQQKNKDEKEKKAQPDDSTSGDEEVAPKRLTIDLEGLESRIIAFPVEEGRYTRIMGTKDGKVIYTRVPAEGALSDTWVPSTPSAKGTLYSYDFKELEEKQLYSRVSDFNLSLDGSTLIYLSSNRLRVLKAGVSPADNGKEPGRKSGWVDLNRVKVSVVPADEWGQMLREAWRLQRDHFWTADMSRIDWVAVYERYLPLVDRIASRSEFSDLAWEMQGELGTSHAYEMGGDYRPEPSYNQGYLGADISYDAESESWRIDHIAVGDVWAENAGSPLAKPGVNVNVGDKLLAINGRTLNKDLSPYAALVNLAGEEVSLTIARNNNQEGEEGDAVRDIIVKTLKDETSIRYRDWVENNRKVVYEATAGRIGYIHIPDMGARGYAEFHRAFLAEIDREGIIVDVRYNGGGHVSQLILEKLARRRIGYDITRWGQLPSPYPAESVLGPITALTNEYAGSDGDIFSHSFKLMGLGPLIGKRTWGGVIGIYPRHSLVDGTVTTQPEFSFWFQDVGWNLENYGTEPDIDIDNLPQDYSAGKDPQLERSIAEIMRMLTENPPAIPEFDKRPDLSLPQLPPR